MITAMFIKSNWTATKLVWIFFWLFYRGLCISERFLQILSKAVIMWKENRASYYKNKLIKMPGGRVSAELW